MRPAHHKPALPETSFKRTTLKLETTLTAAEYKALLNAAKAKNKLAQFLKWQRNRKIILKGQTHENS